jgi:hypothetical protein
MLPSLGGPSTSRLRLAKTFLANSASHDVSGMVPSSFEDEYRSTIGAFSKEPPCSHTDERGWREETSSGDPSGGGDPNGADGGVGTLLGNGLPSLEGECERSVPLLSSTVPKRRKREKGKP